MIVILATDGIVTQQRRTTRFITCTTATSSGANTSARAILAIIPLQIKCDQNRRRAQFEQNRNIFSSQLSVPMASSRIRTATPRKSSPLKRPFRLGQIRQSTQGQLYALTSTMRAKSERIRTNSNCRLKNQFCLRFSGVRDFATRLYTHRMHRRGFNCGNCESQISFETRCCWRTITGESSLHQLFCHQFVC